MINTANGLMIVVVAIATLCTQPSQAEIFKYTDKNGKTVFSDRPPAENQSESISEVELNPTNRSAPPPKIPPPVTESLGADPAVRYTTTITSPVDGTTVPMGPGNFVVTAQFSPPLAAGEYGVLKLDGVTIARPQKSNSWQLNNIFRGEHQVTIERQTAEKEVLDTSLPTTVYVLRPSIR